MELPDTHLEALKTIAGRCDLKCAGVIRPWSTVRTALASLGLNRVTMLSESEAPRRRQKGEIVLFILGVLVGTTVGFFAAALMAAANSQLPRIDVIGAQSPADDRLKRAGSPCVGSFPSHPAAGAAIGKRAAGAPLVRRPQPARTTPKFPCP